ncbi:hypothetical protein QE152_g40438 [Popillia japonica]|uniref:Uncharacterized protein n=1 Tax=Popillia japonica TaxID=7064 RepID=A0AAW1HQB6_POPJA
MHVAKYESTNIIKTLDSGNSNFNMGESTDKPVLTSPKTNLLKDAQKRDEELKSINFEVGEVQTEVPVESVTLRKFTRLRQKPEPMHL